jgi:two-component system OmpR family sensor kinase
MNRLPIRWRLTLAFGLALAAVLTAVGIFLQARLHSQLDLGIQRDLRARAGQLGGLLTRSPIESLPQTPSAQLEPDENIAQILRPDGTVVAASSYGNLALLTPAQLAAASRTETIVDRPGDKALDESIRILAQPVRARGELFIVLVTDSLDERNETLASLLRLEVVGLGAALLAACTVGYLVAGSALRPVEALRRRASEISGEALLDDEPARLPVSETDDEIGRLGSTLAAMLDRIRTAQRARQEALDRQRRFLADASHQLRTPLAIIKAEVELAQADGNEPASLRAALDSTGEEAERLRQLTDQLLVLAAADEQRLRVRTEQVPLNELLNQAAERARPRAVREGRTITVRADDAVVVADPQRLEHALGNLVDNALLHGDGEVELLGQQVGGVVRLQVRDHGNGFAADYLAHPFERFSSPATLGRGSGLGLAIVQAIAEAHGGRARVSNDGGGSVIMELPASGHRSIGPDLAP